MEKKLQVSKYINRELKSYTKARNKELANGRLPAFRPNIRDPNGSWNYFPKTIHKNNNKSGIFLPESVSLSNEDYIMANAQIWVNQDTKFSLDIYNDWEEIIQINFYTDEELNCPICMAPPIIPRTDKCGHVYCLPCLTKFLSFKIEFNNSCALCNQNIDLKRIKRAASIPRFRLKPGDVLSMLLMKRDRNGTFPTPIDTFHSSVPHINTLESRFSNVAVCPNNDLLSIIRVEIMTLEDELIAAFEEGNDRISSISEALASVKNEYSSMSRSLSIEPTKEGVSDSISFDKLKEIISSNCVYYQSEDGSNVFMCPINWKCMSHEFLNSDRCLPVRVCARVIDIENFLVTWEFQNRYKYLRYLPIGSSVNFVELDLSEIVSQSTMDVFKDVIQRKSDSRLHKQKLDDILTSNKIKHENSFNKSGFTYVPSSMPMIIESVPEPFLDTDFVPLPTNINIDENASGIDNKVKKKSFADMIQVKRPSIVSQMSELSVTSDTVSPEPPMRGISLSDCIVIKPTKKKKR